jgi:hypothetical protein
MNRSLHRALILLATAAVSTARAQTPASPPIPPNPKEVASPDAIITSLYDANSVMVDQKRDADRFRSLFAPDARLIPTARVGGKAGIRSMTVDGYVTLATRGRPRNGFSEREIARTSQSFGNIMQVFSTYESRRDSTDQHPSRGINSIQLFNDGSRWWVVTVLWDNERPDNPIPPVFLKNAKSP